MICERMDVTALKAECDVSSSFLPADKNDPSALNASAAWAFCSVLSDLRTPNQVKWIATAAIVARKREAGEAVVVVAVGALRAGGSSSNVGMQCGSYGSVVEGITRLRQTQLLELGQRRGVRRIALALVAAFDFCSCGNRVRFQMGKNAGDTGIEVAARLLALAN